jgi:hypothetical protein
VFYLVGWSCSALIRRVAGIATAEDRMWTASGYEKASARTKFRSSCNIDASGMLNDTEAVLSALAREVSPTRLERYFVHLLPVRYRVRFLSK